MERILQRGQITFHGQPLEVEAFDTNLAESSITGNYCFKSGDYCIHVTGYNPATVTDETLLNYFESRKGANSNVVKALQTDEGNACILQFETEEGKKKAEPCMQAHVYTCTLYVINHVKTKCYLYDQ